MIVHFQIDAAHKRIFSEGLDKMSFTVFDEDNTGIWKNNLREFQLEADTAKYLERFDTL